MSLTWQEGPEPDLPAVTPLGRLRAGARGGALAVVLALGVALSGTLRLLEAPACGARRPLTPWITVGVCRIALGLLALSVETRGAPSRGAGIVAANHSSWLDILVLNAAGPLVFVSKAEVAGWPGIGLLARITGTLFVRREARGEATAQVRQVAERLAAGQRLALFPEGTSTDGRRVLPFKPALLAGLLAPGVGPGVTLQPVTLRYEAPEGRDPRFYAWFGRAAFGPHLLAVLAQRAQGRVVVTWHPPIPVAGRDRKALAREAEEAVRAAL